MHKKISISAIIISFFICLLFLLFWGFHFHITQPNTQEKLKIALVTNSGENKKISIFNKKMGTAIGKKLNKRVIFHTISTTTTVQDMQKYSIIIGLHKKMLNNQELKHSLAYLYIPNELVSLKDKGLSNLSVTTAKIAIVSNLDYPESLTLSDIKLRLIHEPSAANAVASVISKKTRAAVISTLDYSNLASQNIDYLENLKTNQTNPPISAQSYYIYFNKNTNIKKTLISLQNSQILAKLSFNILGQDYTKQ
ncbi:MAG: hypothetical protein ABF991_01620 [Liquorilactobacillus hordei]|uniref:hypothetical protein n=1 Tax=Liquorilactobacillus hordei TaxID=468911 RepID=UPI0039EBB8EF